nr:amidohydrolase family protein [Sphingomonas sp. CDS-1]
MHIDVHAHHLPAPYLEALRAGGGPALAAPHDDATLRLMIERQDAAGIDVQLLSAGPNAPYLRDAELAGQAARIGNDLFADAVARHGGRFAAWGCVPLPHADQAVAEAIRCLDVLDFAGIQLGCSALGHSLDDPRFDDFWAELDQREAVIYVHPGGVVVGTEPGLAGMDDTLIAVTIGSAAEIATAALRLAVLCRKYRRIRPIIGLLGGSLPFLLQRCLSIVGKWPLPTVLSGFSSADEVVAELRRFHYDINLLPDPQVLESARRAYGVDRLVFGSDSPSGTPETAIAFMAQGGLTPAERAAILGDNGRALFPELVRKFS